MKRGTNLMFIDASAVVAVIKGEPESQALLKAMGLREGKLIASPIVRMEATLALARTRKEQRGETHMTTEDFDVAGQLVAEFFHSAKIREVHITESTGKAACGALAKYGKVAGHPAKLNLGDALSYACAKAHHQPLLYKGNDFKHTDLA
ncbi:type II toxin-antitoxin system VapC family toxin [Epibacterium ulvae]|nr:type II toxin-antitoxin system VapC family toxin [Epibacterium ulvae]